MDNIRKINEDTIIKEIKKMCIESTHFLGEDLLSVLKEGKEKETSKTGKEIFSQIIENSDIARKEMIPMCQDTGIVTVFVELGNKVFLDFDLYSAINKGVKEAYEEAYLRKSVVRNPIDRINTKDNTPAIVHIKQVLGDKIKLSLSPKGAGSENMSALKMLNPSDGKEGIINFVLDTVKKAGGRPCPPLVIGIGIGGNFEKCTLMAKEALLRKIDNSSLDDLEKEILDKINKTGIGPMGLGGDVTCLSVHINYYPCHIACLPVAVNISCHANRHKEVEI